MGLSSFFNPDILIGMGRARQAERDNLLTQESERRKQGVEALKHAMSLPNWNDEAKEVLMQKLMTATMLEPGQKEPKGLFGFDDVLNVRPKIGASIKPADDYNISNPGVTRESSIPLPDMPEMLPPGVQGPTRQSVPTAPARMPITMPPLNISGSMRAPEPPPGYTIPGMKSQRQMDQEEIDKYIRQQEVITGETIKRDRARQQAEYEWNTTNPPNEPDEFTTGPDGMIYSKRTAKVVREGTPSLSVAERQMNDWLLKNPGKGPSDYQAFVASQGGEPLYPVVENGRIVYRPRSVAAGADAPRTTYDITGMPTTGGQQGVSLTPPPTIDATTQTNLAGWKLAIDQIDKTIIPAVKNARKVLGPLAGRVKLFEVEKLGGLGATRPQIELAINLRRLLMSQAFTEGGKQLTPTEKEEFIATNPAMTDTLEQALIKAELARDFLDKRYQFRLSVMPARQRGQLGTLAPPTTQGAAGSSKAPSGVEQEVWDVMTPEERALWQNN